MQISSEMVKYIYTSLLAFLFLASCNTADKEKKNSIENIKSLETKIVDDSTSFINHKKAKELLDLYDVFCQKYPKDSLSSEYLFKAGELAMNLSLSTKAIVFLSRFEKNYPNHPKAPYCIFFQAFIYENQLNNLDKARQYYQKFIDNYPDHELVDDAKTSIENLGKPLEEIIKGFEQ